MKKDQECRKHSKKKKYNKTKSPKMHNWKEYLSQKKLHWTQAPPLTKRTELRLGKNLCIIINFREKGDWSIFKHFEIYICANWMINIHIPTLGACSVLGRSAHLCILWWSILAGKVYSTHHQSGDYQSVSIIWEPFQNTLL